MPTSPALRKLDAGEHPFPLDDLARFNTMYVETPRFLQQLTARRAGAPAAR